MGRHDHAESMETSVPGFGPDELWRDVLWLWVLTGASASARWVNLLDLVTGVRRTAQPSHEQSPALRLPGIRGDVKSTMLELLRSLINEPKGRIGVAA